MMLLAPGCATTTLSAPAAVHYLPSVDLKTLDGQPARLASVLDGRVAVVSLWATWCEACRAELDALSRLSDRAGARGAMVVAVAVGEKCAQVETFVRAHPFMAIPLVDEEFRLADALGARRVPTTLVIDEQGRILYAGGALDESALAALRNALDHRLARSN